MTGHDGSVACARERDERFAKLVAVDGLKYVEAWCESADGYPKPEATASARVQGHRMAKRTAARRAYLAQQKADLQAKNSPGLDTSPKAILLLMHEVSVALRRAADTATAYGHNALANSIRTSLSRHVSRIQKVERRGGMRTPDPDSGAFDVVAMAKRYLDE